jgi:hypothetical protein
MKVNKDKGRRKTSDMKLRWAVGAQDGGFVLSVALVSRPATDGVKSAYSFFFAFFPSQFPLFAS